MHMKFMKKKDKKMEKLMRNVRPETLTPIVDRYLRFVYDQHAFTWLCWRQKLFDLDLTKDEVNLFNLKMSFKKAKGYKLRDPDTDELNVDSENLGTYVDFTIPCLNVDLTEEKKKDEELMS